NAMATNAMNQHPGSNTKASNPSFQPMNGSSAQPMNRHKPPMRSTSDVGFLVFAVLRKNPQFTKLTRPPKLNNTNAIILIARSAKHTAGCLGGQLSRQLGKELAQARRSGFHRSSRSHLHSHFEPSARDTLRRLETVVSSC